MENVSKYELIHIDTLESVLCEKINEHYVSGDKIKKGDICLVQWSAGLFEVSKCTKIGIANIYYFDEMSMSFGINELKAHKLIATTNTSLQCPQVVDDYYRYIILWKKCFNEKEKSMGNSHLYDHITGRQAFRWGYKAHSETHSLSDEEVIRFAWWVLNNPQSTSGTMKATLEIFKSTLPIKVYYR